ncbi:ABC transporter ATP-binding protein [Paraburkholderia aromaticivorans]|uniref:ABC transporter ATP-binding protein n=1 Tax=Paraburkholderia aromaticivorans TaxID=2026199 RepID=A0A248VDQ1_9BURK|nr:ABC transporter ATP-binding protein [Paraburkholderia aromaticivorans]ASV97020.1 ABC transporter ATP-binding protein [Paraburkholderia aromaticivorans]
MSSDNLAIRVNHVGKSYSIYDRPQDRLKRAIFYRLGLLLPGFNVRAEAAATEFHALKDVSLDIARGQTVGVIGRNGSGKSTLLQIICGTLAPSAGDVQVHGRVAALLELGAGFNPEFTGRENVYLNATLLGLKRKQIDERLEAIFEFADIGAFIDQPVKKYSSGMYVRLAFAVLAHVDADVLIIDEALAVGDAFFTQKCMRFLRTFMKTGTVLFVSHDTNAVINLCERVVWLDKGSVRAVGPAKDICEQYLEAYYQAQHEASGAAVSGQRNAVLSGSVKVDQHYHDQRSDLINGSAYRNDIEVFTFQEDANSFGLGGAKITHVGLVDDEGRRLTWVVGGESVCVEVRVKTLQPLARPIIGFLARDRLGQNLFGENTYITTQLTPMHTIAGTTLTARFRFHMPRMPVGDYSITAAVADGTQDEHVVHHWVHDAIIFKSHSTSVSTGLLGLPMRSVELESE